MKILDQLCSQVIDADNAVLYAVRAKGWSRKTQHGFQWQLDSSVFYIEIERRDVYFASIKTDSILKIISVEDKLFFKKDEIKVETGIVDNYLDWKMANRSPRKGKIVNVWLRYVYTKDSKIFSKDSRAKLPTGTAFCQELVQFQLDDPHYVRYMEDHFYSKEGRWLDGKYLDKHWYRSNHTDFQDRVKIYVDIPKN